MFQTQFIYGHRTINNELSEIRRHRILVFQRKQVVQTVMADYMAAKQKMMRIT